MKAIRENESEPTLEQEDHKEQKADMLNKIKSQFAKQKSTGGAASIKLDSYIDYMRKEDYKRDNKSQDEEVSVIQESQDNMMNNFGLIDTFKLPPSDANIPIKPKIKVHFPNKESSRKRHQ